MTYRDDASLLRMIIIRLCGCRMQNILFQIFLVRLLYIAPKLYCANYISRRHCVWLTLLPYEKKDVVVLQLLQW